MGEGILSKEELNKLLGKEDDLLRKSGRAVESSGKPGKERLYMRELFFCELKDRFFHMIPYRKKKGVGHPHQIVGPGSFDQSLYKYISMKTM